MDRSAESLLSGLHEVARTPLEEAFTIPPAIYSSPEIHALEAERIFATDRLCPGLAADIPNPGDYITYAINDQPIFVIRGKDGAIRHVFEGINPQGVRVASFKEPSQEEQDHDYLWRIHEACPRRGTIGIFNRSHYEDVLIGKVRKLAPGKTIEQRYDQINAFERMLVENGTTILKFMLHISKDKQRERL